MTKEEIVKSVMEGRSFEGAVIKGVDLTGANLTGGKFPKANFRYSILKDVNLTGADLRECNLRHVILTGANLAGADLRGADLSHVNLKGSNLSETKLDRAILKGAVGISQNVFFTQEILDTLNAENKIEINDDLLTVFTKNNPRYHITPAARFVRVEDGEDTAALQGKVKTEEECKAQGIELYKDSALMGETVYAVEAGFLGSPYYGGGEPAPTQPADAESKAAVAPAPTPAAVAALAPPPPVTVAPVEKKPALIVSDEDLLTEFLLKNLK